jgi:hypothetical protein
MRIYLIKYNKKKKFYNLSGNFLTLNISTRKITAEGAEERRAFNHLFSLRAPLRTLWLYSVFGYSMPQVVPA